jgi:hypothetical protein
VISGEGSYSSDDMRSLFSGIPGSPSLGHDTFCVWRRLHVGLPLLGEMVPSWERCCAWVVAFVGFS